MTSNSYIQKVFCVLWCSCFHETELLLHRSPLQLPSWFKIPTLQMFYWQSFRLLYMCSYSQVVIVVVVDVQANQNHWIVFKNAIMAEWVTCTRDAGFISLWIFIYEVGSNPILGPLFLCTISVLMSWWLFASSKRCDRWLVAGVQETSDSALSFIIIHIHKFSQ